MRIISIDTETHYNPDAGGMSVYIKGTPTNEPFCATVSDASGDFFYTMEEFEEKVRPLCEDTEVVKVGANIKYDIHMFLNKGIEMRGTIHDVLVIHHLLNEEDRDAEGRIIRGLKAISDKYIGEGSSELEKAVDKCRQTLAKERDCSKNDISYKDVYDTDPELMMAYAMQDTKLTLELFNILYPQLEEQELLDVYQTEMETLRVLVELERKGMRVDIPYLQQLGEEMTAELDNILNDIAELAVFNVNSAEELVDALQGLGVTYIDKTESGAWDTSAKVLETVANRSTTPADAKKLIDLILEYRKLAKLNETYVINMIEMTQSDGRIHPSFHQTGTVTGRMSCQNPNFQNIPKKDKRIRKAFVPEEGKRLYFLDFAQQEYRLLAHYAKEAQLIKAIEKGYDVHRSTAAMLYKKQYDDVTDEERTSGKTLNFARQ